jgi:hypothetical protein
MLEPLVREGMTIGELEALVLAKLGLSRPPYVIVMSGDPGEPPLTCLRREGVWIERSDRSPRAWREIPLGQALTDGR